MSAIIPLYSQNCLPFSFCYLFWQHFSLSRPNAVPPKKPVLGVFFLICLALYFTFFLGCVLSSWSWLPSLVRGYQCTSCAIPGTLTLSRTCEQSYLCMLIIACFFVFVICSDNGIVYIHVQKQSRWKTGVGSFFPEMSRPVFYLLLGLFPVFISPPLLHLVRDISGLIVWYLIL